MFNFFNEPADESESGQNGDGQDGASLLATLFGKGGSEEENDTQQTTNVGLFNSTFFNEYVGQAFRQQCKSYCKSRVMYFGLNLGCFAATSSI